MLFPGGLGLPQRVAWEVAALLPLGAWMHVWTHALGIGLVVVLFGKLLRPEPIERANDETGRLVLAVMYAAFYAFPVMIADQFRPWLLVLAASVWLGDTGAYFAGRAFGKHKLYPIVSPKKTIEGSIGGLLASAAGGWVAIALLQAAHPAWLDAVAVPAVWKAVVVAAACGAAEQVGDLVESLMKRSAGIKDSGSLLPGHGGVLDRFDGFVFAAPVMLVLVVFWR
jgi:phosphatidate cytidylyltransferase